MRLFSTLFAFFVFSTLGFGQIDTKPVEGLRENTPQLNILRGATIWISPDRKIENGIIVLRDGFITAVGVSDVKTPPGAREWNVKGKTIYPGFIESASGLGQESPISETNTHWNKKVRPERRTTEFSKPKKEDLTALRNLGFATAHLIPESGIFRGQSCAVNLGDSSSILRADIFQCISLETAQGHYPVSLMGSIALIRQALHDAQWYKESVAFLLQHPDEKRPEANTALDALAPVIEKKQPLFARAGDELDYARILAIASEFDLLQPAILGNGREYRQADSLGQSGSTIIVPLNFPKPPAVENPARALEISLEQLEHWERAPANAAALAKKKIPICLTSYQLDKPKEEFWKRIRKMVDNGLTPKNALAALTTEPANLLGLSARLGTLEPGKIANLVVADGDLFSDENAAIHQVWVDGKSFETEAAKHIDIRGKWTLKWEGIQAPGKWEVTGKSKSPSLKVGDDDFAIRGEGEKVLIFPPAKFFGEETGTARLVGFVDREKGNVKGSGVTPRRKEFAWTARISPGSNDDSDSEPEPEEKKEEEAPLKRFAKYPAGAFGINRPPAQPASILIQNATIWTSGKAGRLEKTDLLIESGKIAQLGSTIRAESASLVIDATGKHITPGLIDCHSHSAVSRGINEGTHSVTVEVRIGDVIDPTDIALYRELAGGLTTANILHGSANPMGGQNQVIKLRWGSRNGKDFHFKGAKPGVKFALGENVKQSNWSTPTNRYPQTRMGVEQIMKDTFLAAREYEKARAKAKADGRPHRRNLRLEAALEILKRDRIVHIHSYRQDEILMFVRLAQEFGFTVGTFQHVLEGYKVADAIAEIGAGGSSFSDWWAYKFEVYDAIPYNGALLHRAGVLTSFNSDSNELATRLNTEAAKAVKYGGLSEEEALKFVTINPARQLRIADRVGSLELGKDADFVIWNGHPLSSFSRAEQTWIDGRRYFDLKSDGKLRKSAITERERLIAKALPERISELGKNQKDAKPSDDAKKPAFPWFLQRDWARRCRSATREIYHNGLDAYTCSGNCCGAR